MHGGAEVIRKSWEYMMARLKGLSALMPMGRAIVWSCGLEYPLSMICFAVGMAAALVPDGPTLKADAPA